MTPLKVRNRYTHVCISKLYTLFVISLAMSSRCNNLLKQHWSKTRCTSRPLTIAQWYISVIVRYSNYPAYTLVIVYIAHCVSRVAYNNIE